MYLISDHSELSLAYNSTEQGYIYIIHTYSNISINIKSMIKSLGKVKTSEPFPVKPVGLSRVSDYQDVTGYIIIAISCV